MNFHGGFCPLLRTLINLESKFGAAHWFPRQSLQVNTYMDYRLGNIFNFFAEAAFLSRIWYPCILGQFGGADYEKNGYQAEICIFVAQISVY